jgi:hypothetical protein
MEIKTSFEIFRENQDFKSSNKQWVSVDELIKQKNIDGFDLIKQLDELEEQLKGEQNGNKNRIRNILES